MNLDRNINYGIITSKDGYVKKILHPGTGGFLKVVQLGGDTYVRRRIPTGYINSSGKVLHWRDLP